MSTEHDLLKQLENRSLIKRPGLKELVSLLAFLIIGFQLALPLLCPGGDVVALYKTAVVFAAFCRLVWQVYKSNFRFRDYFVYLAVVAGLCIWMDSYL